MSKSEFGRELPWEINDPPMSGIAYKVVQVLFHTGSRGSSGHDAIAIEEALREPGYEGYDIAQVVPISNGWMFLLKRPAE